MLTSSDINVGQTVTTKPDAKGRTITGVVLSKGPKTCAVSADDGKKWRVPYPLVLAVTETTVVVDVPAPAVPTASVGQIVVDGQGERYRVNKVNSTRYTATRLNDSTTFYLPFAVVKEVIDLPTSQREWLASRGLSDKDISEFEMLFANLTEAVTE